MGEAALRTTRDSAMGDAWFEVESLGLQGDTALVKPKLLDGCGRSVGAVDAVGSASMMRKLSSR